MVVYFEDRHLVRATHGLIELVVIHEDELARDGLDEVRLRQDAAELPVIVHDGKNERARIRRALACLGEPHVLSEGKKIRLDHASSAHRAAAHEHGGRGVTRRSDQRHARGAGCDFHLGLDRVAAGDDDRMGAQFDRELLDVRAVADKDDDLASCVAVALQPRAEAVLPHRADEEEQLFLLRRKLAADRPPVHRARDVRERRGDGARSTGFRLLVRRDEVVHDLEGIQQARAAESVVHHGQAAQAASINELHGLVDRRVHMHAHDIWLHHILHARAQVGEQRGRLDAETLQCKINPRIRRPAARGDHILPASESL